MARFRFIAPGGQEVALDGPADLVQAVVDGRLGPEALLYDEATSRWLPAGQTEVYRSALALSRQPKEPIAPPAEPDHPEPRLPQLGTPPRAPTHGVSKEESPNVQNRRVRDAAVVVTVIWILLSSYGEHLRNGGGFAYALGYGMGGGAMGGLVIALVRRFARPEMKDSIWLTLALLFAGFSASGVMKAKAAQGEVLDALSTLSGQAQGQPVAPGAKAGSLQDVLGRHATEAQAAWSEYNALVETFDENWLVPAVLLTPEGRATALKHANDLTAVAGGVERRVLAVFDSTESRLEAKESSDETFRGVLTGFRKSRPQTMTRLHGFVAADLEMAAKVRLLVEFLASTPARFDTDGKRLLFDTENQAARYNSLVAAVQQAASEEQAALKAIEDRVAEMGHLADSMLASKRGQE